MNDYNAQQKEAIAFKEGTMLVLAGPGCGKTTVITGRIHNLINNGVSPSSILVVTFTRAAAAQMKERFLRLGDPEGGRVAFGTFHGIFFHILRNELRLEPDCILPETKRMELIQNILESSVQDELYKKELARNVCQEISFVKGNAIASKNYYSIALPADAFRKVFAEYRRWLQENRKLDFDDITTAAYQLFKTRPEVLKKWQGRFKYILIDEFQDVNPLQYRIIKMLAKPEDNLFIVGDDDQSIYRFRGSDPGILLGFPKEYKDSKVVRLTRNYRSTPQIIRAASVMIGDNKKRFSKELFTDNPAGRDVNVKIFDNVWKEIDEVAAAIRRSVSEGKKFSDIAILVRTNFAARAVIERFVADRIPFEAQQEIPCIFDHFIAKDLLAYMTIAAGDNKRQNFLRIINKPNRFISRQALYDSRTRFEDLYCYYEDRSWMWKRIEELEQNIHDLRGLPPYGAIHYIRKVVGYDEYIRDYCLEHKIPAEDLFSIADEITESAKVFGSLGEWLEHIDEYSRRVRDRSERDKDENAVKITTLHGSKGQEYDIVYIIDVNEGIIPFHKARLEEDIEEERRLFYVGMTRARYELNIFAVKERYEKKTDISEFLKNLIPE